MQAYRWPNEKHGRKDAPGERSGNGSDLAGPSPLGIEVPLPHGPLGLEDGLQMALARPVPAMAVVRDRPSLQAAAAVPDPDPVRQGGEELRGEDPAGDPREDGIGLVRVEVGAAGLEGGRHDVGVALGIGEGLDVDDP